MQCFLPTHYVIGGSSLAQIRDDLYQICSKVEPACTVWLYNAVYLYYVGFPDNFSLLSVSARLKNRKKGKNSMHWNVPPDALPGSVMFVRVWPNDWERNPDLEWEKKYPWITCKNPTTGMFCGTLDLQAPE